MFHVASKLPACAGLSGTGFMGVIFCPEKITDADAARGQKGVRVQKVVHDSAPSCAPTCSPLSSYLLLLDQHICVLT